MRTLVSCDLCLANLMVGEEHPPKACLEHLRAQEREAYQALAKVGVRIVLWEERHRKDSRTQERTPQEEMPLWP